MPSNNTILLFPEGDENMPAQSSYEYHQIRDPDFPIIFHQETLNYEESGVLAHWHENIELLWFVDGRGAVVIDSVRVEAGPGELVMIDSNRLHRIFALSAACCYYCLIVDKAFCERFGIPVGEARLKTSADSGRLRGLYGAIASEMAQKQPHYKAAVLAGVLALLAELYRNYMDRAPGLFPNREQTNRSRMVRGAISFLRRSYQQPLTIDDICREVGFSKFYFCRVFHEATGKTVVDYLNFLRCENAQLLLASGRCNVRESAERCGFHNDSYFTRIYKQQIGELPSETMRTQG